MSLTTTRTIGVREDADPSETGDRIAATIREEVASLALSGYKVDPRSIKVSRESILSSVYLNITMQADR